MKERIHDRVPANFVCTNLKQLSVHVDNATIGNPQAACSGERKVEHAAGNPRSAIGYGNRHRLPVRNIGHANSRAKRQGSMGCG
jgi:hypothetical protein